MFVLIKQSKTKPKQRTTTTKINLLTPDYLLISDGKALSNERK